MAVMSSRAIRPECNRFGPGRSVVVFKVFESALLIYRVMPKSSRCWMAASTLKAVVGCRRGESAVNC
jgi:hypothetical protein